MDDDGQTWHSGWGQCCPGGQRALWPPAGPLAGLREGW